jgi:hypothetical protein
VGLFQPQEHRCAYRTLNRQLGRAYAGISAPRTFLPSALTINQFTLDLPCEENSSALTARLRLHNKSLRLPSLTIIMILFKLAPFAWKHPSLRKKCILLGKFLSKAG